MSLLDRTISIVTASALLLGAFVASAAPAAAAVSAETVAHTVTVDRDDVIQEDFLGIGVNLIPTVLMENNRSKGYDESLWQIDRERILTLQPKVARVWFQIDWMEQDKGSYDFDTDKMRAFYEYLDVLQLAGTEIELNFGWKNGREVHDWFGFDGVNPRISAPQDVDAFGDSAAALIEELVEGRGYHNVKYLSFYNEPGHGYDFVTPGDVSAVMHYERMARAVHDQLVEDDLRDLVKIWGPEEWQAPGWTEYMARVGGDFFDLYTFHVYGGTYATLSDEIQKRTSQTYGGEVGMTEFGFSGRYDSRWDAGYGNYVIKLANEGVKVGLIWQLNGVWLEDPDEGVDTNSTYTLWDSLAVAEKPNQRYYEAGPLMRYIPGHSTVVRTNVSASGIRAATFLSADGETTTVVEVDDSPTTRSIDVDLDLPAGTPVNVIEYSEEITPDSSATLTPVARTYTGGQFTDTVDGGRRVLIYTTMDAEEQLAITPDRATVSSGEDLSLSASHQDSSGDVEWEVTAGEGTVTNEGVYTAPEVEEIARATVTARLASDSTVSASSVITIEPAATASRVDLPRFSVPPGDYVTPFEVGLESATEGAVIHYTLDGSTPTSASPIADGPLTFTGGRMLTAVAIKDGMDDSALQRGFFRVRPLPAGPEGFVYCANQSQICGFDDVASTAEVAYGANGSYAIGLFDQRVACDAGTFGSDPAPGVTKMCFVKARDDVSVVKPTFTRLPGEYFEQTLTVEMVVPEGAEVYYTANGALPTTASTKYTGGPIAVPTTRTLKAIAVTPEGQSPIALGTYTITDPFPGPEGYTFCANQNYECDFAGKAIVAYGSWNNFVYGAFDDGARCHADNFDGQDPSPGYGKKCYLLPIVGEIADKPVFSPAAGTLIGDQQISASAEQGAVIRYTTDGTDPNADSAVYSGPIALTAPSTTTIKAIAELDGKMTSMVAVAKYSLQVDPNVGAPDGFTFCANQHYECTVPAPATAAYGLDGAFAYKQVTFSFTCNAAAFGGGDPAPGKIKKCYLGPADTEQPGDELVPLLNAGFEEPTTVNFVSGPLSAGWTFSARSGVQHNDSVFGPSESAPGGDQTAFLKTDEGGTGRIAQSVEFRAGTFALKFWAANRTSFGGLQTFDVLIDGTRVGHAAPADGTYREYQTSPFTVEAGVHEVAFVATTTTGDNTAFLDDVQVVEAEPTPPDTTRPTTELVSPTTSGPFQTLAIRVDAEDAGGLARIVANVYLEGTLVKSTQTRLGGETSGSHVATVELPTGSYTVRYNAQDVAGNISATATRAVTIDKTAPTVTVKSGTDYTSPESAPYELVSFKLYDAGRIDKVTLNGKVKDLTDNTWSDVNFVRPGTFGAVSGTNTLIVFDVAGNTTEVEFQLE